MYRGTFEGLLVMYLFSVRCICASNNVGFWGCNVRYSFVFKEFVGFVVSVWGGVGFVVLVFNVFLFYIR